MQADTVLAGRPRWQGSRHRLEVHYLTATDTTTGTGLWVHCEVVAPTSGEPYAHGWTAVFPVGEPPTYERFGPSPVTDYDDAHWFTADSAELTPTGARGKTDTMTWDVAWSNDSDPLWTFPRWAWQREVLPAAQVVPTPTTRITGTVNGGPFDGDGCIAHIYGHGNAQRWVWLHADLGNSDVLEIVAATARRPGMRVLAPLPLVQLRVNGVDWPRDSLAAALLCRARIDEHGFRITGTVGRQRLTVHADLPAERCVAIPYTDPDGATATCTNTECADVTVRLDRLTARGWRENRTWRLDGTGHAEIGRRP
jgi:hypothetical protein